MFKKIVASAGALLVSASSFAAVDVSAITGTSTDILAVGAAVFGVLVGIKAIKFVRRAL